MPNAGFDIGGAYEVVPAANVYVAHAVVRTVAEDPQPRRADYSFPGVSGAIAVYYGDQPGRIVWEVTYEATSYTNLRLFEAQLRALAAAGRARLQGEAATDQYWDGVEFDHCEWEDPPDRLGEDYWLRTGKVFWRWMQPT